MKQKPSPRRKRSSAKSVLRLPDLEHAKAAVLNSLNSTDAKRGYRHAIDEFVDRAGATRRWRGGSGLQELAAPAHHPVLAAASGTGTFMARWTVFARCASKNSLVPIAIRSPSGAPMKYES
jgi:murein DD-endopeptidase MepM/ murein hydrolase activator NlpD